MLPRQTASQTIYRRVAYVESSDEISRASGRRSNCKDIVFRELCKVLVVDARRPKPTRASFVDLPQKALQQLRVSIWQRGKLFVSHVSPSSDSVVRLDLGAANIQSGRFYLTAICFLALTGCAHSDAWKVASAQNGRAYHFKQWERSCEPVKALAGCDAAARALRRWHEDETQAIDALARKGSISDQLGALKRDRAAVRKAGVR